MTVNNLTHRITERLSQASLPDVSTVGDHVQFVELLAKWNRKINLTSLELEPATDDAIDRLIVEPVAASRLVRNPAMRIIDLGTGGGSPAIPFRIQLPDSSLRMVESRSKKCAFLREATRVLKLENTFVEESRFELLAGRRDLCGSADLVTMRAVRLDETVLELIRHLLAPSGLIFRFASSGDSPLSSDLNLISEHQLTSTASGHLQILTLV